MPIFMVLLLSLLAYRPAAAQPLSLENALAKPILAANQPLVEVQVYTASHVKSMPLVSTRAAMDADERAVATATVE